MVPFSVKYRVIRSPSMDGLCHIDRILSKAPFIISVSINNKLTYRHRYTSVCCSQSIIINWCVHIVTFMTSVVLTWKPSMTFVVIWRLWLMLRLTLWHLSCRNDNSERCDIFYVCWADRGQLPNIQQQWLCDNLNYSNLYVNDLLQPTCMLSLSAQLLCSHINPLKRALSTTKHIK